MILHVARTDQSRTTKLPNVFEQLREAMDKLGRKGEQETYQHRLYDLFADLILQVDAVVTSDA